MNLQLPEDSIHKPTSLNPSPSRGLSSISNNSHSHCYCIIIKPGSGGIIGGQITKPHKKCCMCSQQTIATILGGTIV